MSQSKPSKRKYGEDIASRDFRTEWEEQFLFTNLNASKPVCLVCGFCAAVPKKFNLERHFKQLHGDFNRKYPAGSLSRTDFIDKKKIVSRPTVHVPAEKRRIANYGESFL